MGLRPQQFHSQSKIKMGEPSKIQNDSQQQFYCTVQSKKYGKFNIIIQLYYWYLMEIPCQLLPTRSRQSQKIPSVIKSSLIRKKTIERRSSIISLQMPQLLMSRSQMYEKCTLCESYILKDDMDCVASCQHLFCLQCLHSYCRYKISAMEEIVCPFDGCEVAIDNKGKVFDRLAQNLKQKYVKIIKWKQTLNNPQLKLCPTQYCQGLINTSKGQHKCPQCNVVFCSECQLPFHEGPCDINFQNVFKDWKRCPHCRVFIEKNEGCNHMSCRCGHQFCYVCLVSWSDRHYRCREGQSIELVDLGYEADRPYHQGQNHGQNNQRLGPERQRAMQIQRGQLGEIRHRFVFWNRLQENLLEQMTNFINQVPDSIIQRVLIASGMLIGLPLLLFLLIGFVHLMTNIAIFGGALYGVKLFISRLQGCSYILAVCFWPHFLIIGGLVMGFLGFLQSLKSSFRLLLIYCLVFLAMLRGTRNHEMIEMLL